MMKNCDQPVLINHNLNRTYIPDHRYRILIIGGLGSGKTNTLILGNFTPHPYLLVFP